MRDLTVAFCQASLLVSLCTKAFHMHLIYKRSQGPHWYHATPTCRGVTGHRQLQSHHGEPNLSADSLATLSMRKFEPSPDLALVCRQFCKPASMPLHRSGAMSTRYTKFQMSHCQPPWQSLCQYPQHESLPHKNICSMQPKCDPVLLVHRHCASWSTCCAMGPTCAWGSRRQRSGPSWRSCRTLRAFPARGRTWA